MNVLQLFGRLGADPESRFTSSGQKVTSFRMAVNTRKSGQEMTMWWRVTIWGDRFDKMLPYIKKGSAVIVSGSMNKPEIYNDKSGNPQVSLEITAESIHFSPFGSGRTDQGTQSQSTSSDSDGAAQVTHTYAGGFDDSDEEPMPF